MMSPLLDEQQKRVSAVARRIHGWSWQAFPIGMGTGAVYVSLSGLVYRTTWLTGVETLFYFLNIAIFLLNCTTLLIQVILYPSQAKRLLFDPAKGVFVPLMVLSFATIIIGTINYAVPAGRVHEGFVYFLFWVYIALSLLVSFPMLMIWFNRTHDVNEFTPGWAFLLFPMMLVGVIASNVLRVMSPYDQRAIGVLLVGYFFQGLGFFMTFLYLAVYLLRLITTGFMVGQQANGAFVACGPPGFTALALINLGKSARDILPKFGLVSPLAGEIWYASSVMAAILLYGLAAFLFVFGVMPYWFKLHKDLSEILGCWASLMTVFNALTFPNVGWIGTTRVLGDIFHLKGFYILHACMATLMIITWFVLITLTVIAFWKGKILMSQPAAVLDDSFKRLNDSDVPSEHVV